MIWSILWDIAKVLFVTWCLFGLLCMVVWGHLQRNSPRMRGLTFALFMLFGPAGWVAILVMYIITLVCELATWVLNFFE